MKPLYLLTPAALLFVLGLVTGMSWPNPSSSSQPDLAQPQELLPLAQRADLMQSQRKSHWVF